MQFFSGGDANADKQTEDIAQAGPPAAPSPATHTVTRTFVTTGERRGTSIAIVQGVEPNELVVTAGQLKLSEGAPVILSQEDAGATASGQGPLR